jgi:hypothetical protein
MSTPFITRVVHTQEDGHRLVSLSRRHRKRLPALRLTRPGIRLRLGGGRSPWLQFWAPRRLAWWIALLFVVGSACFALASFAANWPQALPGIATDGASINLVFFVGSLFFTAAAGLQLLEAINGDVADVVAAQGSHHPSWRWLA